MSRTSTVDLTSLPGQGAEIILAQPRGFCAGVDRAIDIVERVTLRVDIDLLGVL